MLLLVCVHVSSVCSSLMLSSLPEETFHAISSYVICNATTGEYQFLWCCLFSQIISSLAQIFTLSSLRLTLSNI